MCSDGRNYSFLWDECLVVEMLVIGTVSISALVGNATQFFKAFVPICTPASSVFDFLLLHISTSNWDCQSL